MDLSLSIFLPTLPARGATLHAGLRRLHLPDFYPRSPRGERLLGKRRLDEITEFLPTLPARGATSHVRSVLKRKRISTHAPRAGSDVQTPGKKPIFAKISPHAPREGSDMAGTAQPERTERFLPTLPARGATFVPAAKLARREDFYPRSPRGERRRNCAASIASTAFLPTLPARGATQRLCF